MNILTFETGETIKYPSEVSELNSKQWLRFIALLIDLDYKKINTDDVLTELVFSFLNINRKEAIRIKLNKNLKNQKILFNVYRIAESLHTFFEEDIIEGHRTFIPKTDTTKNLLPKIRTSFFKRALYGPSDAITDISFREYEDANYVFRKYIETQSTDYLNDLIAILYRPKKSFLWIRKLLSSYNGEARQKYNKSKLENRVKQIAKLPLEYKLAVFYFFYSCEKFIHEGDIEINGNPVNLNVLFESDPDYPQPKGTIGLTGLLFELAESGVFGNAEQTANQNIYDILARLYQIKVSANAIREYYKSQTPKPQ